MIFGQLVEKVVREAVEAYIHFRMAKPDWAVMVDSEKEISTSLKSDAENHILIDPILYVARKLNPKAAESIFDSAAHQLLEDHPEWFPNIKKGE